MLIRGNIVAGIDFRSEVFLLNIATMPKLLFVSAIINIIIYRLAVKDQIKEYEYKSLQDRLAIQEDYYTNTRQVQDRIRRIHHDLNNYMIAIENRGVGDEVSKKMIEGIKIDLAEYRNIYDTGNKLVDIILFEKYKVCKAYGIKLEVCVDMTRGDFIEAIDISSIFANILDNAIEANKYIQVGEKNIIALLTEYIMEILCDSGIEYRLFEFSSKIVFYR